MSGEEDIIKLLRENPAGHHSGQAIAEKLGISRAAVWKRIGKLRKLGFKIEGSPSQGYRLAGAVDSIDPSQIGKNLGTRIIGKRIEYRPVTESTNNDAFALANEGAPEGTCVIADSQTGGRGRLGRKWFSPPGSAIMTSVILRPNIPPFQAPMFTLAAGVAVHRVISSLTGLKPRIKWPNDVLIEGRKVAGVLTEMVAEADKVHFIVVGVGINVNLDLAAMPDDIVAIATSLKNETGRVIPRNLVIATLYRELERSYRRFMGDGPKAVIEEWEELAGIRGRRISATIASDVKVTGRAEGLDDDGALILRGDGGTTYRINAGDVVFEEK